MRKDAVVCGITLILSGVLIFVISIPIGKNIQQCHDRILHLLSIGCVKASPMLADATVLAIVMVIIGITLTIIGPMAPSKAVR
jgi:hypothetical protein